MTELFKSLNRQIAELLDPEFDYEDESIADTERYRRLVRDYEHDLNAVYAVLANQPRRAIPDMLYLWQSPEGGHSAEIAALPTGENYPQKLFKAYGHSTVQEAVATALLAWLKWKAEQK